jgi:MerR family mercuric resistance operon transcriptional regulator
MPDVNRHSQLDRQLLQGHFPQAASAARSRDLGFSIEQVKELLRFVDEPDHTCSEVRAMAVLQVQAAQDKIDDLKRLQKALNTMAARCKGGRYKAEECPIIDALFEGVENIVASG